MWVASLRATTVALGRTAPDESVTVPESEEVSDCAKVVFVIRNVQIVTRNNRMRVFDA